MARAFPQHPYGTQTVLGSAEHLKRPSLSEMHSSAAAAIMTTLDDVTRRQLLDEVQQRRLTFAARPPVMAAQ
jgi:hypothetical protein